MRTDLDHLPGRQRRDLARVAQILFEEFETVLAGKTMPHNRNGKILKIILFGSFARGGWVRDLKSGYVSDYDILVVVSHEKLAEIVPYWEGAEERLMRDYAVHKRLAAPVGLIVHSLEDVNEQLRRGRYFFIDIVKEGIALYEAPRSDFVSPIPLSPELAYEEAKGSIAG
jgi:predicted nucleotidyltransferase